ncbi:hypothetical protein ONZ45_g18811 [Pleurotus djamor]|nr:hypothetical protein ONZ45_g18811 [Pleurotus djamor]
MTSMSSSSSSSSSLSSHASMRNPPVSPQRSRRHCTSFEEGEVDIALVDIPISRVPRSTPSPSPYSPAWEQHAPESPETPDLMPPFDGSSSDISLIEAAFPQPPPMSSPLIRKMKSAPHIRDSELKEILEYGGLSRKRFDIPPVPPLSIRKRRISASTSSSLIITPQSPSFGEHQTPSVVSTYMESEHCRSDTVRPRPRGQSIQDGPSNSKTPLAPKSTHRQAVSVSTSLDNTASFFQKARLTTRRSFAHFRRTPTPHPTDIPPPPLPRNGSPRRGMTSDHEALCRLEDSLTQLHAHGPGVGAMRGNNSGLHRAHNSTVVIPSSGQTPRRSHRVAQSESSSQFPKPLPEHNYVPFPTTLTSFSAPEQLKSFIDITPERAIGSAKKDKVKRMLVNASQFIGLRRVSSSKA